ncbi:CCHC-type domain-containing protein [Trichonephila clavipes]|nr:CCHC-type domain-containing protein [Trichonephila clavipes]
MQERKQERAPKHLPYRSCSPAFWHRFELRRRQESGPPISSINDPQAMRAPTCVTTVQLTGSSDRKRNPGRILIQSPLRTRYANGKSHNITVTQNPDNERTKRSGESSWRPRPRPRQENRPTQQDTGRKTDLWRTSDNVPICFYYGPLGHVTRYCSSKRRVFVAARQRRQLEQYERWYSDSASDYGRDPESNYQRYSPYPRCNPKRRQSRSSSRRSPVRNSKEN